MEYKIIVVDDEISNIEEIKTMIKKTNIDAKISSFINPIEALEACKKEKFDIAFLDIQMPVVNGLEFAEIVRNYNYEIKIIFITAYNHYATEAFEINAIDYILKPLRYERLEKALNKLGGDEKVIVKANNSLSIKTFGEFKLICGEEEVKWNRPKTYELFCYLFLNKEKKVHKEKICESLWQEFDTKRGLANLQVTMCRLRKDIERFDKSQIYIEYTNNYYTLHILKGSIDIDDFNKNINKDDIYSLEKAFSIYRGDFLEDEGWIWIINDREMLRKEYEKLTLKLLKEYNKGKDYEKSLLLVEKYMSKGVPNDEISKIYIQSADLSKNSVAIKSTLDKIKKWYETELNAEVPREIKEEYRKINTKQ